MDQIIEELTESGVKREQIVYINFEDFQYSFITNAQKLYDYIAEKRENEEKYYLFFDEVQMVHSAEPSGLRCVSERTLCGA